MCCKQVLLTKYFVSLSDGSYSENLHSCKHISLTAFEMNSIIFKDSGDYEKH